MKKVTFIILILSFIMGVVGCSTSTDKLLRIQENGLYGFVDTLGNVCIKPQYKYVGNFSKDGYALIISKAKIENDTLAINYGFIDTGNKLVVDTINHLKISISELERLWNFYDAESFIYKFNTSSLEFEDYCLEAIRISQGLYQYTDNNNLVGYKDLKGNIVIPAKYEFAGPFYKNVAIVSEKIDFDPSRTLSDSFNTFSLINIKGEYIKGKAWIYVPPFTKEGLTWCSEINLEENEYGNISFSVVWTQIDLNGNITIGPVSGKLGDVIYNGYPDNNGLYTYYFSDILGIHVGYSFVNKDGQWATDRNGDNQLTLLGEDAEVFNNVTSFSEGFAGVEVFKERNSRWTFMTPDFKIATTELYDSVKPFTSNLAVVQLGTWGVIDKGFNLVIPFKFSKISQFVDGFAYANIRSSKYVREGWINKKGEFIWETNRRK